VQKFTAGKPSKPPFQILKPEIQVLGEVSDLCVRNNRFEGEALCCRRALGTWGWFYPQLLEASPSCPGLGFSKQTDISLSRRQEHLCASFQMRWLLWTRVYGGGRCSEFGVSPQLAGWFPAVSDSQ